MQEPALTVAAVARRLGVAPATLRTWDRRYGLGPTAHTAGAHRRYSSADVARLQEMRRMTLEGVAPADAARIALTAVADANSTVGSAEARTAAAVEPNAALDASASDASATVPSGVGSGRVVALPSRADRRAEPAGRSSGGRVIAMGAAGGSAHARGLSRAALALDSVACHAIVAGVLQADGVLVAWNDVLAPVLIAIGDRWERTGEGVEVEHLLAEVVGGCLRHVASGLTRIRNPRPVLLACTSDEQHTLALQAIAAGLAERDIAARVLGARLPTVGLHAAIARTGPAAVLLWAHDAAHAAADDIRRLPVQRPASLVVVAGPGWDGVEIPAASERVASLGEALDVLEGAATGRRP